MIVRLIVRRLFFLVFVLFGLSIVTFALSHVIAGDPARMIAGPRASAEQVERIREEKGYNDPVVVQYLDYVKGLTRGDLGESISTNKPVSEDLKRYLPATIELGSSLSCSRPRSGCLWASPLRSAATPGSTTSAASSRSPVLRCRSSGCRSWASSFSLEDRLATCRRATPLRRRAAPSITRLYTIDALITGHWSTLGTALKHLALPTIVLAYGSLAVITRMVRGGMLEVLNQDYIRTARAKGLEKGIVVRRHALKNALLPAVTSLGLQVGLLLSGVFLVEIVFAWPGIGRYAVTGIEKIDYSAIMATTLIVAAIFVLLNLVVDVLYLFIDPRISYG